MSLSDLSDVSIQKFHLSENNIHDIGNENFQTIKVSHLNNIYRNEKFFLKHSKKLTQKQLERNIHQYFISLYYHDKDFYNIKVIDDIINNFDTHLVAEFKDYLIMGDDSEFLQKKYNMKECKKYLPSLFDYYKSCSVIFPNYVVLQESKYIFKNIRKKQKVIDNQQEQDDKQEKIKKGEINLDENEDFFTTKAFNSILNQTNTSNVRLFFGINNKNKNNESEDTLDNLCKNIIKAENDALVKKKNLTLRKNFKKINNNIKMKSKINTYKINNMNMNKTNNTKNIKLNRGRNIYNNYYLNGKLSYNKYKNIENYNNLNNKNENNNKKNNNLKIFPHNNRNIIEKAKNYKFNTSKRHLKSNTCIYETDTNEKLNKKNIFLRDNSSNKKMFKRINSNKKVNVLKEKKKKEILTNRELISKIMEKIKNSKSVIFNGHNSYRNFNQKKSTTKLINSTNNNSSSMSPPGKLNSYTKRNKNNGSGGGGIIISINQSNSTPNIIKINNQQINNNSNNKIDDKHDFKKIKVNSNLNISPINEIYSKKDFYNHTNTNTNSNIHTNSNLKNNVYNNTIQNKYENNKKKFKKDETEKKMKKHNLNIYKITQNSITQKYICNNKKTGMISSPNKAITISGSKQFNNIKYGSIKVIKNQKTLDFHKKTPSDMNNNININININNNNIFNNSNRNYSQNIINNHVINNIQHNNISINNKILDKKKYIELLEHSSFKNKRNESQPMLKKIILFSSSSSNRNILNSKKNFIFEDMNKKKLSSCFNSNNTLTFSGYLTTRNSHNESKIKNKIKNIVNNGSKQKIVNNTSRFKKELFKKKDGIIFIKNKIPLLKDKMQNNKNNK
mgnify:CR=1 FL=1